MSFDPFPLVDVGDIIRLVGQTSFQRGRAYARGGAVMDVEWEASVGVLVSTVKGTDPRPYRCRIQLAPSGSVLRRPLNSSCSCPMVQDCKHVAATLIEANSIYIQEADDSRIQRASELAALPRIGRTAAGPGSGNSGASSSIRPLRFIGSEASTGGAFVSPAEPQEKAKPVPRWKSALDTGRTDGDGHSAGATRNLPFGTDDDAVAEDATVPMALLFELRELANRRGHRWGAASTVSASTGIATPAVRKKQRLGIRPVVRSATGNWVRGNLTWHSLTFPSSQPGLNQQHRLWFAQLAGLYGATNPSHFGPSPDWLLLEDFHSPLLWTLFEQAEPLGITLVGVKKGTVVRVGATPQLTLDASSDGVPATKRTAAPLQLRTQLSIDGRARPLESAGTIGDHGIYSYEAGSQLVLTLARTPSPLSEEQKALFTRPSTLSIPGRDVPEFLADYYPRLRRTITITSADASVRLPEFVPPVLILTAAFGESMTLELSWDWEYRLADTSVRMALRPESGESGARDRGVETSTLRSVELALPPLAAASPTLSGDGKLIGSVRLQNLAAARFSHEVLPVLSQLAGLRIEIVGEQPDYQQLTAAPALTIKTEETDQRDWFDLGVTVTIEGRDVPFEPLFAALSTGQDTLLLEDHSYLSLDQPVFEELKKLIHEASSLQEWKAGPRISRYQSSLWADLAELADNTEQAAAWQASVTGLLELASVEPVDLPNGVQASLRPYQQEGFNWLVFLWKNQLGGVLADDMGLGKTLQTLALISHAVNASAAVSASLAASPPSDSASAVQGDVAGHKPFLVVAPTSVVSNWVAEAERFTPGLAVRGITATQAKGGVPLAELVTGTDIVVTSYALFRLDFDAYQAQEWAGMILDEAQFVKNPASHAHRCATELRAPFKLAITGTPMENSLTDLWSLFSIVAPGLFPSLRRFTEEYVRPIAKGDNADLVARLRRRIRPLMMRRTKDLVAKDLPAKQEQILKVELAPKHRKLYDTYLQRERKKLLGLMDDFDKNRFQVFRSLTLLRMLSLDASLVDDKYAGIPSGKLDSLFDQLEDVVAEGHRALIFSQFTSFLKKTAERLDAEGISYCYLDGSTLHRGQVIRSFKEGTAPVFLISLKAGGFGLNLTEADYVFLLDPWWNPASEAQAVDRTHRIGQSKSVMVYRMIATGTIEEKVMALKEKKSLLFDAVMDDDAVFSSALTADDIRGLLD